MKSIPSLVSAPSFALTAQKPRCARPLRRSAWAGALLLLVLCCMGSLLSAQTTAANFGSVQIGTTSTAVPLTFTFTTSDTLASTLVLTEGATGLDYVDAGGDTCTLNTTYFSGQSCTVYVEFAPRFSGNRSGAVVLQDSSGNDMAIGLLQGQGVGPQVLFQPGSQSVLGSGFTAPTSVAVDGNGDIFVANLSSTVLYEMVAVNGAVPASPTIRTIGSGFGGELFVTLDASGNIYVADTLNNAVKEVLAVNGSIPNSPTIRTLGSGFSHPAGIAVDSSGNVYVTSVGDNTLKEMIAVSGSIPSSPVIKQLGSGFLEPIGIAVDPSGDVFIADSGHNAIREIPAGTSIVGTIGGSFASPYLLALDGNNNLYVADYGDNTVREVEAVNGAIPASPTVQVLGSGFKNPAAVALDGPGNVYVADFGNGRVVKLDFADPPSLTFATTAVGSTSADSPQTITVLNGGNATLTLPVPATGENPNISTNFTLNSSGASACPVLSSGTAQPATLAPGASCQLPISFTPTVAGTLSGALVLTDSNLNAPAPNYSLQTIQLNGTAAGSFTLSSSVGSITMTQGSSSTATITITGQNGFSGSVAFSASNLPSGVSASFSPNPATGSTVITLTANSLSSLASSQPITITGTSGGISATTMLLLTVNAGPYFTIGASPSNLTITQGASNTSTITITGQNGFTGNVTLTASGLPSGVTASFSPNPTTATSALTLTASSSASTGTYAITISGASGALSETATVFLTVNAEPSFTISSSVASGGLQAGFSLTSTITVQPIAGFAGTVNLSVSGLPNGLTASFSPASTTSTSLLTITASSSMPSQSAFLTITGSSGTLTASTLVEIDIVSQPFRFSLSASPTTLPIVQGASASTGITITGSGGFAGDVTLGTGLPSGFNVPNGVTASFSPNPATGTSVLTLTASPSTVPSSYNIAVTGTSGTLNSVAYFTLIVEPAPGFEPSDAAFGSLNVGTASSTQTLAYTFGSSVTLGSTAVLTQGVTGLDFADAGTGTCAANTAYAVGQSCTINVTFTPKYSGPRYGAVDLTDNSGNVIATAYLQGTGIGSQLMFSPGTQTTLGSSFSFASGVALDGNGNAYVIDTINNLGNVQEVMAVNGSIPPNPTVTTLVGGLDCPRGPALDSAGNLYFFDVCYHTVNEIQAVNGSIPLSPAVKTLTSQIAEPAGIAVDGSGNIFVLDASNNTVNEIQAINGSIPASPTIVTLASGFKEVDGIAVDSNGNLYVSDGISRAVFEIHAVNGSIPASPVINSVGSGFVTPRGIAVDGAGNVYVAEHFHNAVYELLALNGSLPASPAMQTLGTGLLYANGVAVDGNGNVFVADYGDARLVKLDYSDPPSLNFANTVDGSTSADSPQTITIENNGNASLTFPVPASGNNPSIGADFTLNENAPNACPVVTSGSSAAGTLAPGATCALAVSFAPTTGGALNESLLLTDNNLNAASPAYATQSISLTGTGIAIPTISWNAPVAITYGTPLSATQLNATASVPGTFSYSPAIGTVLSAGTQTITVTFTPTDTTDYTTATATVALVVNQATPTVTWSTPAAITYGTALGSSQLNASSTIAGTFSYSPAAGTILGAGTQTLTATFTPTDTTDYSTTSTTVTLTVNQATPTVTWATPAAITYGMPLGSAQLNASSAVAGTFSYSPAAGTVLTAGTQTLTATFTPTDTTDYTAATATVTLTVNQATPSITWATPGAIPYGTPLGSAQLNASSTVAGTLSYSPAAGTVLTAGTHTLTVTLAPTDATDYTAATGTVTLTVSQATPVLTWGTPAPISYGTALGVAQLNATSNVAGTFSYSPAAGTVLAPGVQTLTAIFTPADTTDYTSASASVTLTVVKATPTITWPTPNPIVYGTPLSSAQLNATANVPGTFSYSPAAGVVLRAGAQTLSVTFTPSNSADYNSATATVSLIVMKATPAITWTTPVPINQGFPLGPMQLDATASVAGTFIYSPAAGTVLAAGNQTLTTSFTPTDTTDYNATTASVVLSVRGFTLSASLGSLTVTPGRSGTDTITVTSLNGFNSNVTLSVSGLPPGVTARFATNPTKGSSVLTFTVSRSAAPGTHTVTVKGISGPSSATTTISLTI